MNSMLIRINEAVQFIKPKLKEQPEVGLVLGSGLGGMAEEIENPVILNYHEIPNFPVSRVEGHLGRLVVGKLCGKVVCAMQGRFHYYEGYPIADVTFGVRTMKKLGINKLIITNAAGGVNKKFEPGDLMIITDHINNSGANPLIGENIEEFGSRFPDLSYAYDSEYIELAEKVAKRLKSSIKKGIYCGNTGPSYETPAEIRMMRKWGADAVGMSTVPEVIAAAHAGMRILGISCITNMAAGILNEPLTHKEVMETANNIEINITNFTIDNFG